MIVEFSLEEEQLSDLTWARDVLDGRHPEDDDQAAVNMLKSLATNGITVGIRTAAGAVLWCRDEGMA